ncbi:MAG: ISAs1 family transposase [Planctomycetaceae bacterium]
MCSVDPCRRYKEASSSGNGGNAFVTADTEVWDGKVLRGTRKGDQRAEQVLVRIQAALGTVLSKCRCRWKQTKQRRLWPPVRNLVLKGKLIVGDAAYCQRDICETIVDSGGDYLVTVKANQPQLLRDIEQSFVISQSFSPYAVKQNTKRRQTATTKRKSRGRIETRTVTTTTNIIDSGYLDWPGAKQIIRLERHSGKRQSPPVDHVRHHQPEPRSGRCRHAADAAGRWLIKAASMCSTPICEDHCRIRTGHAAHAVSSIRRTQPSISPKKLKCSATAICQNTPLMFPYSEAPLQLTHSPHSAAV